MTTIALVHGAHHGAWCWERLIPELERRGLKAVAPDLPCEDPRGGIAEYAAVVEAALEGEQDVVIVGHSLGSLTIPVVASRLPVRRMVFLCSVPTGPGPPVGDSMAEMVTPEFLAAPRFHDADGTEMLSNQAFRELFFHDCSEGDAFWAIAHLRPQASRPITSPSPLAAWPEVPLNVILAADDRAVRLEWAVPAARARLGGGDPIVVPGSHSPFVSRPSDLADILAAEAAR
jgi:pimeloyl-ACP methyl ester carboxylesterase